MVPATPSLHMRDASQHLNPCPMCHSPYACTCYGESGGEDEAASPVPSPGLHSHGVDAIPPLWATSRSSTWSSGTVSAAHDGMCPHIYDTNKPIQYSYLGRFLLPRNDTGYPFSVPGYVHEGGHQLLGPPSSLVRVGSHALWQHGPVTSGNMAPSHRDSSGSEFVGYVIPTQLVIAAS